MGGLIEYIALSILFGIQTLIIRWLVIKFIETFEEQS